MTRNLGILLGFLIGSIISGCSVFQQVDNALPDYRVDYKKSQTATPLEVPPDLLTGAAEDELVIPETPSATSLSTYQQGQNTPAAKQPKAETILPTVAQMEIHREGTVRWLEVEQEAETLWPKIRAFWRDEGFELAREDAALGVMETEWKENRASIPQDGVRKLIGKMFDTVYSANTRDRFKTRLERTKTAGTTTIYLTHRGVEEVNQNDRFVWQDRPTDPELEAEMLQRLMVFIGLKPQQAKTLLAAQNKPTSRATLQRVKDKQLNLSVKEDFEQTWQRSGLVLDRLGFTVEDRDYEKGTYRVRYVDSEQKNRQGFWARLFSSDPETQPYTVVLASVQNQTQITVRNQAGQTDQTTEKILTLLLEHLQ